MPSDRRVPGPDGPPAAALRRSATPPPLGAGGALIPPTDGTRLRSGLDALGAPAETAWCDAGAAIGKEAWLRGAAGAADRAQAQKARRAGPETAQDATPPAADPRPAAPVDRGRAALEAALRALEAGDASTAERLLAQETEALSSLERDPTLGLLRALFEKVPAEGRRRMAAVLGARAGTRALLQLARRLPAGPMAALLDLALLVKPRGKRLAAERALAGLALGEPVGVASLVGEALERKACRTDLDLLTRLLRAARRFDRPEPATDLIRAMRRRLLETLSDAEAKPGQLLDAGVCALGFGDFTAARQAALRLRSDGSGAGDPTRRAQVLRTLEAAIAAAAGAAGEHLEALDAAAARFWRETLPSSDPVASALEGLSQPEAVALATPHELIAGGRDAEAPAARLALFSAARALGEAGGVAEFRLFPWDGRWMGAGATRRRAVGWRARGGALSLGPAALPGAITIDETGFGGFASFADAPVAVAASAAEQQAVLEAARARLAQDGAHRLAFDPEHSPPADALDPYAALRGALIVAPERMDAAEAALADLDAAALIEEAAAWARTAGRPLVLLRPRGDRDQTIETAFAAALADGAATSEAGPVYIADALDAPALAGAFAVAASGGDLGLWARIFGTPTVCCGRAAYGAATRRVGDGAALWDALDRIAREGGAAGDPEGAAAFLYAYLHGPCATAAAPGDLAHKLGAAFDRLGWLAD